MGLLLYITCPSASPIHIISSTKDGKPFQEAHPSAQGECASVSLQGSGCLSISDSTFATSFLLLVHSIISSSVAFSRVTICPRTLLVSQSKRHSAEWHLLEPLQVLVEHAPFHNQKENEANTLKQLHVTTLSLSLSLSSKRFRVPSSDILS